MDDSLVYLYAVGDAALSGTDLSGLIGVGGAPVRVVVGGRLAAVVSSVDPLEFSEESLRRSFEDLSWLAETARAHHGVINAVGRNQPVAPLRLATVYLNDDNVRAVLDVNEAEFISVLDRIRGHREWGVKAFVLSRSDPEPDGDGVETEVGPGAAYLMRKRAARDQASRERRKMQDAAADLHRSLIAAATAGRLYPPQDPRLSGHPADMVLNAAYLVEESASAAFRSAVETWQSPYIRIELTGPWAPYSFATLEES